MLFVKVLNCFDCILMQARDYCEKHNVYDLLTNLMTEVVRSQPDDVVGFLKQRLSAAPAVNFISIQIKKVFDDDKI